jgi:non-ribosomal peptide synthetase component F
MVYTSGSTGKPKGVLKSHKAVITYIESFCRTFDFSPNEVIGNQTPFFFDASAKDIYLMLKLGCRMEILPPQLFSLPPELIDYLNDKKVTFASWVPTVISLVAQLNPFSMVKPETLKKVFFVGEVMPMKHLNKWRKELPDIQYVNLYGSSEIAGICCYYEVKTQFEDSAVLPMGKPLDSCKIYLLDQVKVITEPNHIGELYLVSDALALEYYHDPEKTKQSFIYRDFGEGMVRCFKTGDLAQYDELGNLVFASRIDSQIKHMGHRIELGEIEAVANALPELNRCCCLYNAAKKKITLFCELASGVTMKGQEIRSILRNKLSDYMVPGKVVVMESLPLNQNGKIDRQKIKTLL